jgi:hypothetical protein
MTDSNADTTMLHQRVHQLELLLGFYDTTTAKEVGATATEEEKEKDGSQLESTSVEQRIAALEIQCTKRFAALQDDWNVIDQLVQDLSPGTALTHQRQVIAPILYRKQEILASVSDYRRNIEHVQQILNLISIGQTTCNNKTSNRITEQEIINAPILVETIGMTSDEETDLDRLATTLIDLQHRIHNVSYQLDTMMDHYTNLVTALSEKIILIGEKLDMQDH